MKKSALLLVLMTSTTTPLIAGEIEKAQRYLMLPVTNTQAVYSSELNNAEVHELSSAGTWIRINSAEVQALGADSWGNIGSAIWGGRVGASVWGSRSGSGIWGK
jgi:hypothetical protein